MAAKKKTAKKKTTAKSNKKDIEEGKLCAILSYLFPIGLIWYFVDEKMKKNKYANFHVKQSLALFIVWIAINIVAAILFIIGPIIAGVGGIAVLVLWIIGIIHAYQGENKELWLVGEFAKKFPF